MGCGGSTPAKADDDRPPKPSPPQQAESPCLGLEDDYAFKQKLGQGGTGLTYLAEDRKTKELVAIKLIKRPIPKVLEQNILREIVIQANLGEGHVNIINAFEAVLTETHLALVMEYAACGSLTSYVANRWQVAQHTGLFLSEDEARYFMRQFIPAVDYCHKHNVAHRDLKLDNTLLTDGNPPMIKLCDFGFAKRWENNEEANMHTHIGDLKLDNTLLSDDNPPLLKLCDFGFARTWSEGQSQMFTHIGTPVYMSPELINRRNQPTGGDGKPIGYDGKLVDVWAGGVLLIVMLLGTFPFDHTEHPDPNSPEAHLEVWMQQVKSDWKEVSAIKPSLNKLSDEVKVLLDKIFKVNEKERITIDGIREDPWYQGPLQKKFSEAEQRINKQQQEVEERCRQRALNPSLIEKRTQELTTLVSAGTSSPLKVGGEVRRPTMRTPEQRVDLREQSVLGDAGGVMDNRVSIINGPMTSLTAVNEDGAEGMDPSIKHGASANGTITE
ncbi:g658 [Coccomyxa viridis]|uniref:G658 protein n=1 Tax=Coccomyxa viridis TaxID=1274662 RepID=A0ABP1FN21_9CHLO